MNSPEKPDGEPNIENASLLTPLEKDLILKYKSLPLSERKIIDEAVDAFLLKHTKENVLETGQ